MDLETSSSAEEQARKNGWTPKEEYSGDPSKWKSAEAFNETGEMIGRFKKSESQVRQ